MKRLLILRHAKSSWETNDADHERPLNPRGERDAPRIGRLLRDEKLVPDLIISSTAARAQQTTQRVTSAADFHGVIERTRALYLAEPNEIVAVLRAVDDGHCVVLIVGHNPGLEEFVEAMCSEFHRLPTAALVHLEIPVDRWADVSLNGAAHAVRVWRPKEL